MNTGTILRAMSVAVRAHGNQMYGNRPYIAHPIEVAQEVFRRGGTEDQIVAALLHDVVEDTAITLRELRYWFNANVIAIVEALTHDPSVPYDTYVDNLPDDAVLVKLCDSICNLRNLEGAEMTYHRRRRLNIKYTRNVSKLSARLETIPLDDPSKCQFCHGKSPSSDGRTECGWCVIPDNPLYEPTPTRMAA